MTAASNAPTSHMRSSASDTPCPTPTHMVASASRPPLFSSPCSAVSASRAPDMPSGWPSAIAPPCGLTCSASSARPSWRRQASPCEANASLISIRSKSTDLESQPLHQLAGRRHRADAHHPRLHASRRHAEHAPARGEPVPLDSFLRGQDHRRRAVIDAGGVARGHGAGIAGERLRAWPALRAWSPAADARPCRP